MGKGRRERLFEFVEVLEIEDILFFNGVENVQCANATDGMLTNCIAVSSVFNT
jgi:hypothetical protein